MATVTNQLFSWQAVEASSEIQRFHRLLDVLDDHELIAQLQRDRKGKRDDYPVACVWNSLLAAIIFQHSSIASLRRELMRNGELRQACGFDTLRSDDAVPSKDVYTRFFKSLLRHMALVEALFHNLVERLGELLPDFGQRLAIDGKAVVSARQSDPDADVVAAVVTLGQWHNSTTLQTSTLSKPDFRVLRIQAQIPSSGICIIRST